MNEVTISNVILTLLLIDRLVGSVGRVTSLCSC